MAIVSSMFYLVGLMVGVGLMLFFNLFGWVS